VNADLVKEVLSRRSKLVTFRITQRDRLAASQGKLKMMLRRKMRVTSEGIATEGRARQLEVTVAEGPIVRIAFPPAASHERTVSRAAARCSRTVSLIRTHSLAIMTSADAIQHGLTACARRSPALVITLGILSR
jgi:hypothetical protein